MGDLAPSGARVLERFLRLDGITITDREEDNGMEGGERDREEKDHAQIPYDANHVHLHYRFLSPLYPGENNLA